MKIVVIAGDVVELSAATIAIVLGFTTDAETGDCISVAATAKKDNVHLTDADQLQGREANGNAPALRLESGDGT